MQTVRAFPLALALLAVPFLRADEALSPILVPRSSPTPAFIQRLRERPPPPALISEHARIAINAASYEVLATAKPFDAPGSPTGRSSAALGLGTDATVMEPFVVRSVPIVINEAPVDESPLLQLIKTGILYQSVSQGRETVVFFNAQTVTQNWGLERDRDFTRVALATSLRW
jgi:hypothetical protein